MLQIGYGVNIGVYVCVTPLKQASTHTQTAADRCKDRVHTHTHTYTTVATVVESHLENTEVSLLN